MQECFVYWIKRPVHSDILSEGYIGITVNPERRWKSHKQRAKADMKNHKLYSSLRKYDDFEFVILIKSTLEYCLELENKLRPTTNIGLNHAVGGIQTSKDRLNYKFDEDIREKISKGLKRAFETNEEYRKSIKTRNLGKKKSEETKMKLSDSIKGKFTKWKNPRADISVWANAQLHYSGYLEAIKYPFRGEFNKSMFLELTGLVHTNFASITKAFKEGWNPNEDAEWLDWKNSLNNNQ